MKRASKMVRRYGLSEKRMIRSLYQMSADARERGIGMTVPVVGNILSGKRADFLKGLCHERFEIAVHGYRHDDFSALEVGRLRGDISKAKETFEGYGFHPVGYRSPYLRPKEDLARLLSEYGFAYSSSKTVISDRSTASNRMALEKSDGIAREIYGTPVSEPNSTSANPESGVIEIPVSLPDDEILIDRMGIRDDDLLGGILEDVIRASLGSVQFAVIQIHPERYLLMRKALLSAVDKLLREGDIGFVTLRELNDRIRLRRSSPSVAGNDRFVCVTGDLDIMSLRDLWN